MTDSELLQIVRRIGHMAEAIVDLMDRIPDHPNGLALLEEMHENGMGYTWNCEAMAFSHLSRPEKYAWRDGKAQYKVKT